MRTGPQFMGPGCKKPGLLSASGFINDLSPNYVSKAAVELPCNIQGKPRKDRMRTV